MEHRDLMKPGKWHMTFDENGACTAAVYDASYRELLGVADGTERAGGGVRTGSVHPDDEARVNARMAECLEKRPDGPDFDIEYRMMTKTGYRWFHSFARMTRREDGGAVRADGVIFDIQEGMDKTDVIAHERLRSDVLAYMTERDDDPIELLKNFAERIRVLIGCDQVIYRDLEETRIMVNSPAIEDTWHVPIEYCRQCEHFDAHHPMYAGGYTEMDDCREGWQGIPVYKDCPIRSSLTRIVYCDGEIAGYLAFHYVQRCHHFTDTERATLEEFTRILSISLSRYEARKRAGEVSSIKKTLSMNFVLSDQYDPIIVLDPETGEYDWLMSVADNVAENTSMSLHGDNLYRNIAEDSATIIHPEDREQYRAFYTKENMLRIARTGEVQETENRWFIRTEGQYRRKYNKAVRMVDDNGKAFVVVGVIDTTEARKEEEKQREAKRLFEEQRTVAENSARFFALEDTFIALYDVELESGRYVSFERDDFYRKNVSSLVVPTGGFFDTLRANVDRVVWPEDREATYAVQTRGSITGALREKEHIDHYYRIATENGPMWLKMRIVYRDADRKNIIVGIFNAEEEMAARQRDEAVRKELYETNARLFALEDNFESMYDVDLESGHYDVFVKGDFYRNNVLERLSVPQDYFEELRANIDAVIFEEDRDGVYNTLTRESIRKELSASDHFDYYYRLYAGGGPVWFKIRVVYKDEQKKRVIIGVFNAEKDVETRQLTENMQMIRGLADGYDALYYINIDERVCNIYKLDEAKYPGARDAVEGKADFWAALRGYGLSGRVHPEDRRLFEDFGPETVRERLTGRKRYSMRFRIDSGEGWRWNELEVVKYEDADEQANAVAAGFADRDEEIRREQEDQRRLEEARRAAEAANESKTNFLFNMSHDIRTPMNAITGFTNMAVKHIDDKDKVLDCLKKTQKAGGMLLNLINSVLEGSRIESGHAAVTEQPGDVYYSFANIEHTMRELAETKDIDLSFDFGEIRDRYVYADFSRCMRIFVNIISNAIKYTPDGGRVKVLCEQAGGAENGIARYRYTIEDNGIGMSEEFQKHVFEQFARENTATVSGIQGTGLGMSVVKSFTELLGGTVTVKSRQGVGTVFTVTLPFRLQDKEAFTDPDTGEVIRAAAARTGPDTPDLRGLNVLLVEDNELNREIATDILEEEGLAVETADDGTTAVEMLRLRGPAFYDFILMDIQMPKMNGYEATKAIRAMYPDARIPIIALSANAFAEDRIRSAEAGMDDHVAKPINIRELFCAIAKYIR